VVFFERERKRALCSKKNFFKRGFIPA